MFIEYSNLLNKNVILRADFNVPLINNKITSSKRIDACLETINFILNQKPNQFPVTEIEEAFNLP